mmetsp:Transcript_25923/g.60721  ORF Transcript_25923/g.60721 Transcript_25923/m.60721 type:complete len:145 (+) Transcript_25923:48-482(+)
MMSKSLMLFLTISLWSASAVRSGPGNQHGLQDHAQGPNFELSQRTLVRSTTRMPKRMLDDIMTLVKPWNCDALYESQCIKEQLDILDPTKVWDVFWLGREDREDADIRRSVFEEYKQHWTRAQFMMGWAQDLLIFADPKRGKCA